METVTAQHYTTDHWIIKQTSSQISSDGK